MKKMNRRDYLISMGATAGALAGTANLDVFAQSVATPNSPQKATTQRDTSRIFEQKGIRRFTLHPTESVKLVFYGMMAFWRNADEHCLIGFHSMMHNGNKHQLEVTAYRKEPGKCTEMNTTPKIVLPGEKLELEIVRPDVLDGVYFYQPPPSQGLMNDNDFRWVPDLESQLWYGPLPTKPVFDPVLKVRNGLFYTFKKTESTFRRQKANGMSPAYIGHLAEYVCTKIYLESGGRVTLNLPKETIEMPQVPNVQYEVHFLNYCLNNKTGKPCSFNGYHPDKIQRSDFYMHFHGLGLPPEEELELVIARGIPGSAPAICGPTKGGDESPCSAYGFGGPGGFPLFP